MWIGYSEEGCRVCRCPAVHRHRLVPGAWGGKYEATNVARLCPTCHTGIHVLTDWVADQFHGRWRPWAKGGKDKEALVTYFLAHPVGRFFEDVARPLIAVALDLEKPPPVSGRKRKAAAPVDPNAPPTFASLCGLEPALSRLADDVTVCAVRHRDDPDWCMNAAWYGYGAFADVGFKPRMVELVGLERMPSGYVEPPAVETGRGFLTAADLMRSGDAHAAALERAMNGLPDDRRAVEKYLRSAACYDVAYEHLVHLLPDCRDCGCL